MGIIVGGDKAWKVHTQGQLVIAFHWINREPSMVLFPLRKRLGCVPFVIPQNMMYAYAKSDGYPTPRCMAQAFVAARVMALDETKSTIENIVSAILDFIPELKNMPPEPQAFNARVMKSIGEIALYEGGKKVLEADIPQDPDPDYTPAPAESLILPNTLH